MTTLSITTDAPADPATVTEYGDALPELIRALNHITLHQEAMVYPSDVDRLIRNISLAASGLQQLADQVSGWIQAEQAAGRITMADGSTYKSPAVAADVARLQLEQVQAHAVMLHHAADAAAAVTSDMEGVEGGSSEEGERDG